MDTERTSLPGIGFQHVFTTARNRRIGVVSHRSGRRDLVIYDKEDPDSALVSVELSVDEANGLAELIGTPRVTERLAELRRQVDGLATAQLAITDGSPFDGNTLGDTQARSRTGASIVAVVRGHEVVASPRPDFTFHGGDIVVVVGTEEGVAAVATILTSG
ncbi:cation:proton antiporter regulatory subunit [Longispora albida]|uniref:cation:proton antiporter regulatory subunit n=1 Tax=Longispora albida TaxID=203523 RepID=UPI000365BFE3|nr:TrkA C-terminal domain-containing protein [Longispora albida]